MTVAGPLLRSVSQPTTPVAAKRIRRWPAERRTGRNQENPFSVLGWGADDEKDHREDKKSGGGGYAYPPALSERPTECWPTDRPGYFFFASFFCSKASTSPTASGSSLSLCTASLWRAWISKSGLSLCGPLTVVTGGRQRHVERHLT